VKDVKAFGHQPPGGTHAGYFFWIFWSHNRLGIITQKGLSPER
jgi:hypothetical protein